MDLSNVLSINGKPGLYKLVSKGNANFIVEAMDNGKRFPVFSHDGVSSLDNISIFTTGEDVPLGKVFQNIFRAENGAKITFSLTDAQKLKTYFGEVLPDYDKERVYVSNIKKILSWYNILVAEKLIDFEDNATESENESTAENDTGTVPESPNALV
ncbi:MAG: DUF5606 domain-containing protein [Bacteroidales bacterium]|jgi:hypothetical protein|nr:DUF5606 domain-containing protein [Bacteroidales bacterium]